MPFIFTKKLAASAPLEAFVLENSIFLIYSSYVSFHKVGYLAQEWASLEQKCILTAAATFTPCGTFPPLKLTPTYSEWAGRENPEVKNRPSR